MTVATAALAPAFTDQVDDSQTVFRLILEAMARPGYIFDAAQTHHPPAGAGPAMSAAMLTLLDSDTPVWLDAALAEHATIANYITFHCGCPLVTAPGDAAFAFSGNAETMLPLDRFNGGNDKYPETSATIVMEVTALAGGPVKRLRGPGIKTVQDFGPIGLPAWFWHSWALNRAGFPLGVDVILTCGDELAALPRSVFAEE